MCSSADPYAYYTAAITLFACAMVTKMDLDRDLAETVYKAFPAGPDELPLYPVSGQQHVIAALLQDVDAGRHLLCVTGAAGSGKTVLLHALRQNLTQGLVGLIEQPVSGGLLRDVARSMQLPVADESESVLRRRLVMQLSMVNLRHQPIIQIVDDADGLSPEDMDLLLHFFPQGHTTLILAGTESIETGLIRSTATGSAHIDAGYRIDPFTVVETTGYIRYRLRAAGLPEDLFQQAAIEAIHHQSGGLPGRINQLSAEVLAQAAVQGEDSVTVAVVDQAPEDIRATPKADVHAESAPAPVLARRRRTVLPVRPVVAPSEASYVGEAMPQHARRLERRLRRWRAAAVLAGIALVAVLLRDVWLDRLPSARVFLDDLAGLFADPSVVPDRSARETARPTGPGDSAAPAGTPDVAGRSSDFAVLSTAPVPREDAEASLPSANDEPVAPSPGTATAEMPPPEDARDTEADLSAAASRTDAPENKDGEAAGGTDAKLESVQDTAPVPAQESPTLTRAQRAEIARLYAQRAEYEWRNGDLEAASVSIQRGLSSDPGNPRLLEMRDLLREVRQQP